MQDTLKNNGGITFQIIDLSKVLEQYNLWISKIPSITPYYAVKSNNDETLLGYLKDLNVKFDAASIDEITRVLSVGANPDSIIFANTRKFKTDLKKAYSLGVKKMTFDSLEELEKMRDVAPLGDFILRIKTNDEDSITPLSSKFGAPLDEAKQIIRYAFKNNISIKGISFHVGSNAISSNGWIEAMKDAKLLFDYAKN